MSLPGGRLRWGDAGYVLSHDVVRLVAQLEASGIPLRKVRTYRRISRGGREGGKGEEEEEGDKEEEEKEQEQKQERERERKQEEFLNRNRRSPFG